MDHARGCWSYWFPLAGDFSSLVHVPFKRAVYSLAAASSETESSVFFNLSSEVLPHHFYPIHENPIPRSGNTEREGIP